MAIIFLNAFLLFLIQPMIGKQLLPVFGGAPLVWNTCLLFFQFVLLLGYLYAHSSLRKLGPKRQPWLQLAVLLVPVVVLPIRLPSALAEMHAHALESGGGWAASPLPMLLAMLFVSVGLPFLALSSGAPVIQRWFSHTGDEHARDPYFLYSASNFGSVLALLSYPVFFERVFDLKTLALLWSAGYVLLFLLVTALVLKTRGKDLSGVFEEEMPVHDGTTPTWRNRLMWIALAAGPSALLLGVTAHLSANVAPVPLLWVLPLSLYLLTFIIAFARKRILSQRAWTYLAAAMSIPIVLTSATQRAFPLGFSLPVNLLGFFFIAAACHTEANERRPSAGHLTEFYLWISVGGVLGGFFSAIVAPLVFTNLAEYPIALVLCFAAIGVAWRQKASWIGDLAIPLAGAAVVAFVAANGADDPNSVLWIAPVALVVIASFNRPMRVGLSLAAVYLALNMTINTDTKLLAGRNFFGPYCVQSLGNDEMHVLMHGTTRHGTEFTDTMRRDRPTTYYSPHGGGGRALLSLESSTDDVRVAIVGLGAGTLAAYGRPGDRFDFYEIDPDIEKIARNPDYFHYLSDSPAQVDVNVGDARLRLQEAGDGSVDMLMLDAFSSDAVPVHLLTVEAFQMYFRVIKPDGLLVIHVTNHYLNLPPVVAASAEKCGMEALLGDDEFPLDSPRVRQGHSRSKWMAVGTAAALAPLKADPFWKAQRTSPNIRAWTDDYSNVLSAMVFFK